MEKISFDEMKFAKMNFHDIKDVIVVLKVFVCVDRSKNIKRDIHIWHTYFTCKSLEIFHVFVNCFIICETLDVMGGR